MATYRKLNSRPEITPPVYRTRYLKCPLCGFTNKFTQERSEAWTRASRPKCPQCGKAQMVVRSSPT